MMKKLKKLVAIVTLIGLSGYAALAQGIDQKKMNKDIEIAEDILMSMMKQDKDVIYDLVSEPSGMYVADYGVIFNVSGSASPYRVFEHWGEEGSFVKNFDFDFNMNDSFVVDTKNIQQKAIIIARDAERMARENQRRTAENQKMIMEEQKELEEVHREAREMAKEAQAMAKEAEREARRNNRKDGRRDHEEDEEPEEPEELEDLDIDEDVEVHVIRDHPINRTITLRGNSTNVGKIDSANFRQLMIDFLVDYASLIGQLKSDQMIMVTSGTGGRRQFGRSYYNGKLTAEVTKGDLEDYKKEKISREQLINKIKIATSDDTKGLFKDLELFSTILERVYEHDLAETYYISKGIDYEKLGNFGVIYNMKMYSSKEHNGKYSMPTQKMYDLSFEERNKKVEELYPKFEQELKGNILDYGRTIKSLNPNETVLFQVKLTECKGCDMPESIDVSVKQSVLSEYDSGKLSKSAALAKVTIKKH
ncbi:cell envelope integrity protein TolA [Reichenbachiella sp. MALMAid0571]|uniref:cell envelope integrity protein TolA n=1 Tax=Reichenbachiella sp. MALMAid0571 TaxID=3143939 RepID=UPI0032DF9AA7